VKAASILLGLSVAALAFQQTAVRTVDEKTGTGSTRMQLTRNANGREIPIQSVEERVVSDAGGVRVVERTIRRYDANGMPGPPERERIETAKERDGSVRTTTTLLRGDINGTMQVAERSTALTRETQGGSSTTVTVERPTLNASFNVIERREETSRTVAPGKSTETVVTQRPDPNGRMVDIGRRTAERTSTPAGTIENVAEYETAATGQMQLMRQVVTRAVTAPDGVSRREVDTFEPSTAGRAAAAGAAPQLTKRQIIETRPTPTGTVETISAAFPLESDPGRVGALRQVEQNVCTGDCGKTAKK
jgi:hypothetical protein